MKRNLALVFLWLVSSASLVCAQVREEWVARYHGPGNGNDSARALALDAAGNVYVTGKSFGFRPNEDYATLKYNAAGIRLWEPSYHGPGNGTDQPNAMALDADGNMYVTGWSWGGPVTGHDYAKLDPP